MSFGARCAVSAWDSERSVERSILQLVGRVAAKTRFNKQDHLHPAARFKFRGNEGQSTQRSDQVSPLDFSLAWWLTPGRLTNVSIVRLKKAGKRFEVGLPLSNI